MIKMQIIGNLGKDCVVKEFGERKVINFSVAHTEKYKKADGSREEKTIWVECAYWTDRTAISQYLLKGKMVYAEGTPEVDGYLNKDGKPSATLRMRVQNIQLLGGAGLDSNPSSDSNRGFKQLAPASNTGVSDAPSTVAVVTDDGGVPDDLPF